MAQRNACTVELTRRRWLALGIATAVGSSLDAVPVLSQSLPQSRAPSIPQKREASNGGSCPYPIPWLDKNGNHNQPATPNVELSNMYHFKGKLARCSGFHGMGTDNQGNRNA